MLEKTYDPASIEVKWYTHWEEGGAFKSGQRPDAEPFVIVIPPPNVTGSLHMGHALDNTLQDVLIRYHRLLGKDVLWQPGTDHAGIATQNVVEKQLDAQGLSRKDMGRDAFLERVWQWKEQSGGTITGQLRRLGASCDWSRERFTMDEGFSKAVLKVFVELYNQGLVYRAKRLVNWDPQLKTAISDLEVEAREIQGHMWHFKYPLAGGETYTYVERDSDGVITLQEERDYISIATTRPETMLGDGAVAVHPDDERYAPIVGKLCEIPVGPKEHRRLIPIITDEYPDPEFGSGAVKITGAHDENDYGVAQRNAIPMYRLMDENAAMRADGLPYAQAAGRAKEITQSDGFDANEVDELNLVPDAYRGLDRFQARKKVVADIDADGLMIKVEDKVIMQPFGDRSNVVIEPMLTDQWYVDAATLAKPAIAAVKTGKTKFVPATWEKTYFNWMENIQPWCVSRQLWWGHQIPAWYDETGKVYVAETQADAQAQAGVDAVLTRDPDVLDTWFSSGLWPFGTMGWPDEGGALGLDKYYPNTVLVTGFDIIFFWVARMMMQGIHFMNDVPFSTVYIHALVRDETGAKMSKSKGNVVDPLVLIDQYGADALRFTLAAMETQGRDIKLSEKRVEGYRNFGTKLWNAARFCQMNGIGGSDSVEAPTATLPVNQWIISELAQAVEAVTRGLEQFRYSDAANAAYQFTWNSFCDWYLELSKTIFSSPQKTSDTENLEGAEPEPLSAEAAAQQAETRAVAGWVLDQILVLLHPFMPFITEELWHALSNKRKYDLIQAKWPDICVNKSGQTARADINWLIKAITAVRTARAEANVPAGAMMAAITVGADDETRARALVQAPALKRLARIEAMEFADTPPSGPAVQVVVDEATLILPLEGVIDLDAERARLSKAIEKAQKDARSIAGRLSNEKFIAKAPEAVVAENREKLAAHEADAQKLEAALARLG